MKNSNLIKCFACFLFFALFLSSSCQNTKKILNQTKNTAALTIILTYKHISDWIESEEGSKMFCMSVAKEHKEEIKKGTYSKMDHFNDCLKKRDKFEQKFDQILNACASSLETFEHTLDVWDSIDKDDKIKVVKDLLLAIKDLERLLDTSGVPVPDKLKEFSGYIEGVANSL